MELMGQPSWILSFECNWHVGYDVLSALRPKAAFVQSSLNPLIFAKDVRRNLVFGWLGLILARGHKESLTFSLSFLF